VGLGAVNSLGSDPSKLSFSVENVVDESMELKRLTEGFEP
jgi:hypothetical protein